MTARRHPNSHSVKSYLVLSVLVVALYASSYATNHEPPKQSYLTDTISRGNITNTVSGTGSVKAEHTAEVGSQVSGKVKKLHANVNDAVNEGELLAEIDTTLLVSQLRQDESSLKIARAGLDQSRRDLSRLSALHKKGYVAESEVERAQQVLLNAESQYDAALTVIERDKANLAYANITAPFDGVVLTREVTEGQTLQASFQTPILFTIAGSLSSMQVDVEIHEADIRRVTVGAEAQFTVASFPDRRFTGVVSSVGVNPSKKPSGLVGSVTYTVTVSVDNQDMSLLPGMTAYVNIIIDQRKDVLRVPHSALGIQWSDVVKPEVGLLYREPTSQREDVADSHNALLVLGNDGPPIRVPVTLGISDDTYVEVVGNVREGDKIVTGVIHKSLGE